MLLKDNEKTFLLSDGQVEIVVKFILNTNSFSNFLKKVKLYNMVLETAGLKNAKKLWAECLWRYFRSAE